MRYKTTFTQVSIRTRNFVWQHNHNEKTGWHNPK